MKLSLLDWSVIAAYFLFNLGIGIYYARRARGSTTEFFLAETCLVVGRHVDGRRNICG